MTVADLIKQLQKMDQDLEVWGNSSMGGECGPLNSNPFYNDTAYLLNGGTYKYWIAEKDADKTKAITKKKVAMLDIV